MTGETSKGLEKIQKQGKLHVLHTVTEQKEQVCVTVSQF